MNEPSAAVSARMPAGDTRTWGIAMALFDTVIKGGMLIDGTRVPRYRADLGIRDGRVELIGSIDASDGDAVIDATNCIVAPGFVDLHTHYDAQLFWDPYCTISGWHGATSVVIGNCGFGFAPVEPDLRERMMLSMTRVEAIPLNAMRDGLPWDWVTFPEFLESVDRAPKGVNILPYVPMGPVLVHVLGLKDAKEGRNPTETEMAEIRRILNEAMDAGGCGWSAQRLPPWGGLANQRDFDGTPMPTDCMSNETALALAQVLADRNEGFIQMTYSSGDVKKDAAHYEELARVSGRPLLYNAVQPSDQFPQRHRNTLAWLERCRQEGLRIYGQAQTSAAGMTFTMADFNLFDESEAFVEATTGTFGEKLAKMADPARRPKLREESAIIERGAITGPLRNIVILKCIKPELTKYNDRTLGEVAEEEGKHVVDVMLDISVQDNLESVFYLEPPGSSREILSEVVNDPYTIYGISDGGAHTKFFTGGRYPTETLINFVREKELITLEEAHWRLSAFPAFCAGFRDRGTLRTGAPADIIIYNLDELEIEPMEVAYDLPGGEWRRIQKAKGYRYVMVNGETTFINGECTGATPGRLLRHGDG
jgi:N-acyl-D-amino-acid deacylase